MLRSPVASPKANAICERVIGTIRRECLDWMIPISQAHLRAMLREWVKHYKEGRPHKSLGPAVPDPPKAVLVVPKSESRHRLAAGAVVLAKSVLNGLHHEYSLAPVPASAVIAWFLVGTAFIAIFAGGIALLFTLLSGGMGGHGVRGHHAGSGRGCFGGGGGGFGGGASGRW